MPLIIDRRWEGPHGIGRFAREVASRIPHEPLSLLGKPLNPIDPVKLSWALRGPSRSVFFSPGFNAPLGQPCPFFFTIHDLIHLEVPEESSTTKRAFYELIVRPALKHAAAVFTVSEFSKSRILNWGKISPEKIIVVGNGVSPIFSPEGEIWEGTARPYFLYVGNHKPHKNTDFLIKAFNRSRLYQEMDLILTGVPNPRLRTLLDSLPARASVKFLGLVDEPNLAALYRGSRALIIPSRYEGFGLPLIEALACGTAVISSNQTSLPEIGGDRVRYFDPENSDSLVERLFELSNTPQTTADRELGILRALDFSWNKVSQNITDAIQQRLIS